MAGDSSNLLYIGAILSVALGAMSLRIIRKNKDLEWNEALAARIICWMFIGKGIQNAAVANMQDTSVDMWQFYAQLSSGLDNLFTGTIIALALIYPVPLLRSEKQVKIGFTMLFGFLVYVILLEVSGNPYTVFELPGIVYWMAMICWSTMYLKFRLIDPGNSNDSTDNIAIVSGLFLTLLMGHIWMWWPGMVLQSNYFYFFDLAGGPMTSMTWDYMWNASYTICIVTGIMLLGVEIFQYSKGNGSILLYLIIPYFILGAIGYIVYSAPETTVSHTRGTNDTLASIWNLLTSQLHFTVMRPLIAMFVLLKFGLFNINEETKPMAKIMTIILIVVATSAILELIQSIVPINQMISAALLGIIIALGIGWEERSFDSLASNKSNVRVGVGKRWFPNVSISQKTLERLDLVCFIYILVIFLISFIVWQTDMLVTVMLERYAEAGGVG